MNTIGFENIRIRGDLARRTVLNFSRLESKHYRPETVFTADQNGWPGDWEGRTILALTLLGRSTGRTPAFLEEMLECLQHHMNEKGYMGRILPEGVFDEQQMSGHSWLLRGLVEYYLWKKEGYVLAMIERIVENLLLPARGYYRKYPSRPEERVYSGEAAGNLTGMLVGSWYTSTDTGCAFIMLDGASHAYELLGKRELKDLLDEMSETFAELDLTGLSVQTHATLSALRGMMRLYGLTHEEKLVRHVEKVFSLYKQEGMTENYANYNWFNRPEWTEPCAVVDSFILAVELWKNTGKEFYLQDAENILYNGMGHGQRPNGGFGCDTCAGAQDEFLSPKEGLYEAYWCCTMRGSEGLSRAVEYGCFLEEKGFALPFYHSCILHMEFPDGRAVVNEKSAYPYEGAVCLEVVDSECRNPKTVSLRIPSWVHEKGVCVRINGVDTDFDVRDGFAIFHVELKTGCKVELTFDIPLRVEETSGKYNLKGYHSYRHGSLLLGYSNKGAAIKMKEGLLYVYQGAGKYQMGEEKALFMPIHNIADMEEEDAKQSRKQILFQYEKTVGTGGI